MWREGMTLQDYEYRRLTYGRSACTAAADRLAAERRIEQIAFERPRYTIAPVVKVIPFPEEATAPSPFWTVLSTLPNLALAWVLIWMRHFLPEDD
jgi:hypothetical protein